METGLPLPAPGVEWSSGLLRDWVVEDAPRLVDAWHDPEIARYNPVPPEPTLETASRWIANAQNRRSQRLSLDLVIEADGLAGEVGLSDFDWTRRGALIGYWLLPTARGRGVASEAVREFTMWACGELELDVLIARCHESNRPSQLVAERAGYTHAQTDSTSHQLWTYRSQ